MQLRKTHLKVVVTLQELNVIIPTSLTERKQPRLELKLKCNFDMSSSQIHRELYSKDEYVIHRKQLDVFVIRESTKMNIGLENLEIFLQDESISAEINLENYQEESSQR